MGRLLGGPKSVMQTPHRHYTPRSSPAPSSVNLAAAWGGLLHAHPPGSTSQSIYMSAVAMATQFTIQRMQAATGLHPSAPGSRAPLLLQASLAVGRRRITH